MMKKTVYFTTTLLLVAVAICSCNRSKSATSSAPVSESTMSDDAPSDTTLFGVCGEGTMMNTLELVKDTGDTLHISLSEDVVKGGLMAGDRMAVTAHVIPDLKHKDTPLEMEADCVVNLTTLMGHWVSIDRSFELVDGGEIVTEGGNDRKQWLHWKMFNGKLLLDTDTFSVFELGADTLALENKNGIFTFKRKP